jgi:hypothetical protein
MKKTITIAATLVGFKFQKKWGTKSKVSLYIVGLFVLVFGLSRLFLAQLQASNTSYDCERKHLN